MLRSSALAVLAALAAACGTRSDAPDEAPARPSADTAIAAPVDTAIPPAIAGADGWNYERRATADLDRDGAPEDVVLTARVELYRGQPAWDDGQPWQVYVEFGDGTRTYLYAQRIQLGTLEMRISEPDSTGSTAVVLLEQTPHRITVYEASVDSSRAARVFVRFQRALDTRGPVAAPRLP